MAHLTEEAFEHNLFFIHHTKKKTNEDADDNVFKLYFTQNVMCLLFYGSAPHMEVGNLAV